MRFVAPVVLTLGLAACTTAQLDQARDYHGKIQAACAIAMTVAPLAPPIAPWIVGGCGTEAAIARLALDPNSLAWLNDLIAKARRGG